MKPLRHAKLDANHLDVCRDLRKQGVEVVEILQPVDTICRLGDFVGFVEIKIEGSRATYTRTQLAFIAGTRMPIAIAKNAADVMRFLKTRVGLSQKQKDALAAFLTVNPGVKQWHPAAIRKVLEI